MSKAIEKIEAYKSKEIEKAMSKLKKEYSDAWGSFSDTGYDRYQKKMDKCEKEIQEIEAYLHKGEENTKDLTTDQYKEYPESVKFSFIERPDPRWVLTFS